MELEAMVNSIPYLKPEPTVAELCQQQERLAKEQCERREIETKRL